MKERPILFNTEMARAFVEGRKTQTRRPIKASDSRCLDLCDVADIHDMIEACRYGVAGDRLWGKEAHAFGTFFRDGHFNAYTGRARDLDPDDHPPVIYREVYNRGGYDTGEDRGFAWRPSIFMPRWASRITAEIERVRIEKLGDISEADAIAEGTACWSCGAPLGSVKTYRRECHCDDSPRIARDSYAILWETIHGRGAWDRDRNEHVFVVSMVKR